MATKTKGDHQKKLPVKVSERNFNRYIKRYLRTPVKGRLQKISNYKIFNYILYVLHAGIQWKQLKPYKREIHWSNVYKRHNRWSKDGSYRKLFESSVLVLDRKGMLDLSILHGDGTNIVAKKGARKSDTQDTNTRRERKHLR
ncbi:MAG: transposase [Candidatus Moraniibacteriota bacterium]|nr:MAG: transposase [Candidatus Moranbacteria bacterium]